MKTNSKKIVANGAIYNSKLEYLVYRRFLALAGGDGNMFREIEFTIDPGDGRRRRGSHRAKGSRSLVIDFLPIVDRPSPTSFVGFLADAKGVEHKDWTEKVSMIGRDIGLPVRRIKHPATAVLLNLKSAKPDDRSWAQSDIGPVLVRISEEVTPDGDRKILNIPITTMRVINRWKGGLFEAEFLQDTSEMEMYRTTKWSEGWEDRRDAFEEKFGIKIQLI